MIYTNVNDLGFDAISFIDTTNGWLFGNAFYQGAIREIIYRTTNGGYDWYQESVDLSKGLQDGIMIDRYHGWAVSVDGSVLAYTPITALPENVDGIPTRFTLHPNYPNPFNATTSIGYEIPTRAEVRIVLYDELGRVVRVLVNQVHEPGRYQSALDGSSLGTGVYFYRMVAGSFVDTKQLLLIK
jgi:hypothetical protein